MLSQNENIQGPNQHQEIMIGRTKIIKLDLPQRHFKPNCRNSKKVRTQGIQVQRDV